MSQRNIKELHTMKMFSRGLFDKVSCCPFCKTSKVRVTKFNDEKARLLTMNCECWAMGLVQEIDGENVQIEWYPWDLPTTKRKPARDPAKYKTQYSVIDSLNIILTK